MSRSRVDDFGMLTHYFPRLWLDEIVIWFLSLSYLIHKTSRQEFNNLRILIWNWIYPNLEGIHSWHNWGCCDEHLSAGDERARLVLRNRKGFNILTPLFNLATRYLEFDDLFFHIQIKYLFEIRISKTCSSRLNGLGVWFSLWVREVPGSNPGWAHLLLLTLNIDDVFVNIFIYFETGGLHNFFSFNNF